MKQLQGCLIHHYLTPKQRTKSLSNKAFKPPENTCPLPPQVV